MFLSFFIAGNKTKCRNKVDLGFILDSSGSVSRTDFQKMKTFVKNVTDFFTVSPNETRVSVMTFASSVIINIPFSKRFYSKSNFHSIVDNIGYIGSGTATAMALNLAYNDMFTPRYGARDAGQSQSLRSMKCALMDDITGLPNN